MPARLLPRRCRLKKQRQKMLLSRRALQLFLRNLKSEVEAMSSRTRTLANRRNARHSTGPCTVEGKKRASLNARKHGLSIEVRYNATGAEVEALAVALGRKILDPHRKQVARNLAERTFELKHFQEFKLSLLEVGESPITTGEDNGKQQSNVTALKLARTLPILAKLERYERMVQSRQWRAIRDYVIATDGVGGP